MTDEVLNVQDLRVYYHTPAKDSDVRPIVAYLRAHALHGPGQPQDWILIAPAYMRAAASYVSREALTYEELDCAGLGSAVAAHGPDGRPTWLIVDYRCGPAYRDLDRDARVKQVDIPPGTPEGNKLFRVVSR